MQHTHQSPKWWQAGVPFLLLGGLLGLEPQIPLSPGGHQIVQLTIVLLMFGVVLYWLRYNRGALVNEAYEREQAQAHTHTARQQPRELSMDDAEPWDDAELPWQSNGHDTDIRRRQ